MRRTGRVTIAVVCVTGALAAPGGASAAGPLDEVAGQLGCTSGQDGLRCTGTGNRVQEVAKKSRACRIAGDLDYQSCFKRGHRRPLPAR